MGKVRLLPWEKVGQTRCAGHTGLREGRLGVLLSFQVVAENLKKKEMTLKTKGKGFTCSWGWPPSSTVTQLLGWEKQVANSLPLLGPSMKWRV